MFGSPTWTRTRDIRINSPLFYQLNYWGVVVQAALLDVAYYRETADLCNPFFLKNE